MKTELEVPIVRDRDPATSHIAAGKQKLTGRLHSDRINVLRELIKHPNSTGAEIGFGIHDGTGRCNHEMAIMARKRLSDLDRLKYARVTGSRFCTVLSNPASVYEATDAGKNLINNRESRL